MKKLILLLTLILSIAATSCWTKTTSSTPDSTPSPEEEDVLTIAEEFPRFPGCEEETDRKERKKCADEKMIRFIYSNLEYPEEAKKNKVEGTVIVKYYVDVDGTLMDLEIIRDIGAGCGQAALEVIEKMNTMEEKWIPGIQRGKNVKVYFNLPVRFRL